MRLTGLIAPLFALLLAQTASALDGQTPLDSYLSQLKTLRTEFSQSVTDSKGRKVQGATGKLTIVRPGKFRWELTPTGSNGGAASPQLMVADGKNLWFYDRDLDQVSVKPSASALTATPAGLLAGDSDVRQWFTVSGAGKREGLDWVKVVPKQGDADIREAQLAFDKTDLRRMVLKDKLGQTVQLDFLKSERNPVVPDTDVQFAPPPGADVIGTPTP
ncbi:MAG TPA: outer membrane lipoprotein chaperone LolA [Steroidobacteraceae bacterium]|nr:outer membrane lipoprotein chaperone LolA [Steroidobacteraceae bacterium]